MNAGKKAVVTGGTHGMGPAIVEALLVEGVEVVLTGRNEDNLAQARARLAGRPVEFPVDGGWGEGLGAAAPAEEAAA
ncbi:SDR family NAD(P)-dependent oxidoreductase [Nocardia amamiensis]|uniref:SDR family NAD(P)-dependent oxidoreductase n=1 Tax=Nocardia amamiensis TaxID=404578 RepID=UPI002B4B1110|nr:SDR family NAD(P)-dependent oxidoreductase [Nocardia amamiensis]